VARAVCSPTLSDIGVSRDQARTGLTKTVFGSWTKGTSSSERLKNVTTVTSLADAEAMTWEDMLWQWTALADAAAGGPTALRTRFVRGERCLRSFWFCARH
jgi:hypothetical protein